VTIIHFNDDPVSSNEKVLTGWWQIDYSAGQTYYYCFEGLRLNYRVLWTTDPPANSRQSPPVDVQRHGYWIDQGSQGQFVNCWRSTGSVEIFQLVKDTRIKGQLNSVDNFIGKKMF
jgi:hypothetical protein